MSSLTDIIFLLLIFFMLTSTLVAPNAIKVNLPSSTGQTISKQSIIVSIDENSNYYIDDKPIAYTQLEEAMKSAILSLENPTVVLRADRLSTHESVVNVLKLGPKHQFKVILATSPD